MTTRRARSQHPRRSSNRGTYRGIAKHSTPIYDDAVKHADAYRTLSPVQKLVLFDMMRVYYRASKWDTLNIDNIGFAYTYKQCQEDLSPPAFYDALKAIKARGWFKEPIELQEIRCGASKKHIPSRSWEQYKATPEESRKLCKKKNSKQERLKRDKASLSALQTRQTAQTPESSTT